MTTELLVQRASLGDGEAFREIVERVESPLRAFLRARCGTRLRGRAGVDDLVQESLLLAWQGLEGFRWQGEIAFRSWLLSIAVNVVRTHQRRANAARRDVRRELPLETLGEAGRHRQRSLPPLVDGAPARGMRREERFNRLRDALLTLRPDHRKVIALVRLEGLSLAEAGRRLGRSPEATSMLLLRALRALRSAFGETESVGLPDRRLAGLLGHADAR